MIMGMNTIVNMTLRAYMMKNNIPGFSQYRIDTDGNIFGTYRSVILKPRIGNSGYLTINLVRDGDHKPVTTCVHRLLAIVYKENPLNLKEVNHINKNKLDNRLENLEWVSTEYNQRHQLYGKKRGVYFSKRNKRYIAHIKVNMKYIYIGSFTDQEEAYEAYKAKYIEIYGSNPW